MARDQLRPSSSANIIPEFDDSQEDLHIEQNAAANRTSKAQKILGATEIPLQQPNSSRDDNQSITTNNTATTSDTKKRTGRPSFMKGASFVPFPAANSDAGSTSQQQQHLQQPLLRVRASSPLLAHGLQSHDVPPNNKKVHQSGYSSTLFSYFSNSRDSDGGSGSGPADHKQLRPEPSSQSLSSKNSKTSKDSKRKLRPPRIDLSLLFPKPKPSGEPLLSPQRLTHSPSPVSATVSDFPKSRNLEVKIPERKYTAAQTATTTTPAPPPTGPPPAAIRRPGSHRSTPADRSSAISTETRNTDWLEPPLHRTVRTSEMDMALQNYSDQQKSKERSHHDNVSSIYSKRTRDQLHNLRPKSAEKDSRRESSGNWSKETYLSPKSRPQPRSQPGRRRPSPSPDEWPLPSPPLPNKPADNVSSKSKKSGKSGKSTLVNSDLNNSSVLCLSSSEDEDTDHDGEAANDRIGANHLMRESVNTYGDLDAEICTASAAKATKGPTVRRLDLRQIQNNNQGARTMLRSPSINRNPSMSSAGRSSYFGRRGPSIRSSGIPTISEPDILSSDQFPQPRSGHPIDHFPQPRSGTAPLSPRELRELSRRSRVMAVTRQEEDLLEAMRVRKGKVTPSLFDEKRFSQSTVNTVNQPPLPSNPNHNITTTHNPETDRGSVLSGPSRESVYSADMSFLRLSASIPSYTTGGTARTDQGAAHMDKDGLPSQGAASDAEQKTLNSSVSPRASLVYSESLPSPATSGASPLTPTLPIHRFSSMSSQPPPSQPLPAVPSHDQRQHSRRRTDSSEAIVLGESADDTSKENDEFPIWALGWNQDQMAAVH